MPDLADIIEEISRQQLRDEARLGDLEVQAADIRGSIATAKKEVAQLLSALEIAVKRGLAQPTDLEAIQARLSGGLQEHLPFSGEENDGEDEEEVDEEEVDEEEVDEEEVDEEEGDEEEEEEEGEGEGTHAIVPASRSTKLIDIVFDIIQGFAVEREFTTADIRRELAKRYPEKFADINPASVSGTVARLFKDYDTVIRVGGFTDGIHYRRKVKTEPEEVAPMIATTNPP